MNTVLFILFYARLLNKTQRIETISIFKTDIFNFYYDFSKKNN